MNRSVSNLDHFMYWTERATDSRAGDQHHRYSRCSARGIDLAINW